MGIMNICAKIVAVWLITIKFLNFMVSDNYYYYHYIARNHECPPQLL